MRGNRLTDNQTILVQTGYDTRKDTPQGRPCQTDVVIDSNTMRQTAVGIILDSNTTDSVVHGNRFEEVGRPYEVRNAASCTVVK